jgi:hypothetical protein
LGGGEEVGREVYDERWRGEEKEAARYKVE